MNAFNKILATAVLPALFAWGAGGYSHQAYGGEPVGPSPGWTVQQTQGTVPVVIPPAPAPLVEVVPPCPGPDYTWQPGYWSWNGESWIWIGGCWVLGAEPYYFDGGFGYYPWFGFHRHFDRDFGFHGRFHGGSHHGGFSRGGFGHGGFGHGGRR